MPSNLLKIFQQNNFDRRISNGKQKIQTEMDFSKNEKVSIANDYLCTSCAVYSDNTVIVRVFYEAFY